MKKIWKLFKEYEAWKGDLTALRTHSDFSGYIATDCFSQIKNKVVFIYEFYNKKQLKKFLKAEIKRLSE